MYVMFTARVYYNLRYSLAEHWQKNHEGQIDHSKVQHSMCSWHHVCRIGSRIPQFQKDQAAWMCIHQEQSLYECTAHDAVHWAMMCRCMCSNVYMCYHGEERGGQLSSLIHMYAEDTGHSHALYTTCLLWGYTGVRDSQGSLMAFGTCT